MMEMNVLLLNLIVIQRARDECKFTESIKSEDEEKLSKFASL